MALSDSAPELAGVRSGGRPPQRPKNGYEQGIRYDGGRPVEVSLNLRQIPEDEAHWRDEITRTTGLAVPAERAVELTQVRYWGDPASPMIYCRFTITDQPASEADLDALIKAAKRTPRKTSAPTGESAYVVALGDLQLGKVDGDGVEGTVNRFRAGIDQAIDQLKALRKRKAIGPVFLVHLGDCIEGFVSQGGANSWRTSLTLTEQVRLYRRLLLEQVKAFAPIAENITLVGVPGNHDEANRPLHTYGDSWAIDGVEQVADAMALAGNYEHVTTIVPKRDELTVTFDAAGTILAAAHGHQFPRGDWAKWWAGQSHGRQPVGEADLLLAGHLHHLNITSQGKRTFLQVPALESESTWWKHRTGEVGNPGIVTMTTHAGDWDDLRVLGL